MSSSTTSDFPSSKLEDLNITHDELNSIGEALKKEEFRKLLCDYVEEIQNPENRKIYEEELTELERQRGVDITFVTPKACFVVKTSSNGSAKTFINICSNENIGLPTSTRQGSGLNWQVPYVLAPPRPDYDKKQEKCNVYDVVFHPNSIELGKKNKDFKQLLLDTALNGIEQSFNVTLDKVNLKYPNIPFKGSIHPTVLRRKADPSKKPKESEEDREDLVQKSYNNNQKTEINGNNVGPSRENSHQNENSQQNGSISNEHQNNSMSNKHLNDSVLKEHETSESLTNGTDGNTEQSYDELNTPLNFPYPPLQENKPVRVTDLNAIKNASKGTSGEDQYATPHYVIKEYNDVDLDNYTNDMYCKSNVTIPSKLIVEIKLPMLKTMEFTKLDICGRKFEFVSEKPSKYKLNLTLPYAVNDENGTAKFEMDKKRLVVILPVVYKNYTNVNNVQIVGGSSNGITPLDSNDQVGSGINIPDNLPEETCDSIRKGTQKSAINETNNNQNTCSKYTNINESTKEFASLPNTNSMNVESKTPTRVQQSNIQVQNNDNTTNNYLEIETDNNSILNVTNSLEKTSIHEIKASKDVIKTKPLVEVIETELFDERETKTVDQEHILTTENGTKEGTPIESGANRNNHVENSIRTDLSTLTLKDAPIGSSKLVKELPNGVSEEILNNSNKLEKKKVKELSDGVGENTKIHNEQEKKTEDQNISEMPNEINERKNQPKDAKIAQSKDVLKDFWSSKVFYQAVPEYQVNANDNELVFIFNVINVEQDSIKHVLVQEGTVLGLQFVSIGAGFFRSHHGILLRFDHPVSFSSLFTLETNIILRLIHTGCPNSCYYVSNIQGGEEERRVCIPMPEYYMENDDHIDHDQEPIQHQTTAVPSQTEPCTEQNMNQTTESRTENDVSIEDNEKLEASRKQVDHETEKGTVINEQKSNEEENINENLATSRKQKDVISEKGNDVINEDQNNQDNGTIEKPAVSKNHDDEVNGNGNVINGQQSKEEEERGEEKIDCEESKKESKEEEESDKENQDEKRGGGRVESKGMNIPKSKSTSLLSENRQQYRVRGILKTCSRSLSISSDEGEDEYHYSSSSCSVKKHVRFDEHISRKLFSSKCTILEQEKKYQKRLRHLSHKRERRVSETEASDSENRDRNNKFISKKQAKRMNRNNKNNGNGTNGTNTNNGSKHGKNKLPGSGDGAAASWDSQHSEMSEDESKTSCSCSATSESGGNTSDSGDSGAASGDFNEMKLSVLAASRKEHKRRGKKNARKSASSAKTAAASGGVVGGEFGNSYLFELDMN